MAILKLLLLALIFSLIPGQLVRLNLSSGALTLSDILVLVSDAAFICYFIALNKTINLPKRFFSLGILFMISALASTIFALNYFSPSQILSASFFLVRLVSYFFVSILTINLVSKKTTEQWLNVLLLAGIIFSLAGVFQFVFLPDLAPLQNFGWDPHYFRLVSTTLDPNYTGFILSIFAAVSLSLYLYKKKIWYLFLSFFFTTALILTFSRSSYLAFLAVMLTVGTIKSPKVLVGTAFVFLLTFTFIVPARERIIGAFLVDDTATARIISWQKAITIFTDHPVFGVGFNTYRSAQESYGFFENDDQVGGHSGSGADSSFLLIAATTGLVGFSFFISWIISILLTLRSKLKNSPTTLAAFASFVGLIVHTQFVNSFMFPQVMLIIWFLVGLSYVQDN